ncbi:hypothetical protein Moror_6033 [Moniliophthora roreri MCA 2997]|uniref:Uncharacterized protein n=1 Tax=Moniliophthora roreri (strain MCA 2997) TaxID=1381753 RepID=V2WLQ6_MONRO|nr:hypothetical protein Moror_6033 [Moniliophthora roreri MCA 2997]
MELDSSGYDAGSMDETRQRYFDPSDLGKTQTTVSCNIRLPPRVTFLVSGQKVVGVRQWISVALVGTVGVREILMSWWLERTLWSFLRPVRCCDYPHFSREVLRLPFGLVSLDCCINTARAFQNRSRRRKKPVFSLYRALPRNRVPVLCLPALVGGGYFRTMDANGDAWRSAHSIFVLFGPENHGSHFERYKTAFEEVTTIDKTRVDKTQLNSSIRTVTARTTYEVVPEGFTSDVAQK